MAVQEGNKVTFQYTLSVDGQQIQSTEGGQPMEYTHGQGQIIPGLADGLDGMREGEEKTITLEPQQAYGEVDPNAFREVPRTSLPEDIEPQEDMMLLVRTPDGQAFPVRIAEVKDDSVVLDLNHPLAGKELTFDVRVVSVE